MQLGILRIMFKKYKGHYFLEMDGFRIYCQPLKVQDVFIN